MFSVIYNVILAKMKPEFEMSMVGNLVFLFAYFIQKLTCLHLCMSPRPPDKSVYSTPKRIVLIWSFDDLGANEIY